MATYKEAYEASLRKKKEREEANAPIRARIAKSIEKGEHKHYTKEDLPRFKAKSKALESKKTPSKVLHEFERKSPEMKEARKGYNDQKKADGLPTKRGTFKVK